MKWSRVIQWLSFFFCVYTSQQTEATCFIPTDEHVASPYYYFGLSSKVGDSKAYQCERGYQPTASYATCTENGWSPNPLCIEVMCTVPTIENAKSLKKPGTNIEYQCLPGYEPDRFVITCNQQGEWDNMHQCTVQSVGCGRPPSVEHAVQDFKEHYRDGETAHYECPSNYVKYGDRYMTCTQGRWTGNGKCSPTSVGCGRPPSIAYAVHDFKERYKDGERATYDCPAFYIQEGDSYLTCRQGRWIGNARCVEPCTVDVQDLAKHNIELRKGGREKIYAKHLDYISFVCKRGYRRAEGSIELRQQCSYGYIPLPVCE